MQSCLPPSPTFLHAARSPAPAVFAAKRLTKRALLFLCMCSLGRRAVPIDTQRLPSQAQSGEAEAGHFAAPTLQRSRVRRLLRVGTPIPRVWRGGDRHGPRAAIQQQRWQQQQCAWSWPSRLAISRSHHVTRPFEFQFQQSFDPSQPSSAELNQRQWP